MRLGCHLPGLRRPWAGIVAKKPVGSLRGIVAALAGFLLSFDVSEVASSHQLWVDGSEVPAWVKAACCGPADAHVLAESAVHMLADGVRVDGLAAVIPYGKVLPSQDGKIWAFYAPGTEPNSTVYCFFYPGSI